MKQVIYVDILIAVNLFVNYFLLLTTAKILCLKWKTSRLILSEVLGAIYSLYIFFPQSNWGIAFIIKFFMSFTIIWAAFGIKNFNTFLKSLLYFHFISFLFSGIMFAMWYIWKPNGMSINNSIVYFNISPIMLIVFTFIAYIIIEIFNRITSKQEIKKIWCEVEIKLKGKHTVFKAKIDTGNSLREPFSNLPVIVARESTIAQLLPVNIDINSTLFLDNLKNIGLKFRMIPFKTVSGEGLLPAFKPDIINISKKSNKEAYVAICSNKILPPETPALINPDLLD